jgi:hypothetical protein
VENLILHVERYIRLLNFAQGLVVMDVKCSFFAIVGGHCGPDTRVKNKSSECVQLLSCNRDITGHKSSLGLIDIENEVDLILSRASMFTAPENIEQFVICPAHRSTLGTGWKLAENEKCRIPVNLSRHSDEARKKPRGETKRGLSKAGSHLVLHETGVFLPVGSGLSFLILSILIKLLGYL